MAESPERKNNKERLKEITDGIEQGIKQGIKQGEETGTLSSIRNLMNSLEIPAEKAMELLNIPADEQQKYMDRL